MNLNDRVFSILNETPDYIEFKNKELQAHDKDAHSFMFDSNDQFRYDQQWGRGHSEFHHDLNDNDKDYPGSNWDLSGRLWLDSKIIAFWKDQSIKPYLGRIMKELKKEGIDISDWMCEYSFGGGSGKQSVLLPFKEYAKTHFKKDVDKDKLHQLHMMDSKEKKRALQSMGVKTGFENIVLPKGMTLAQYNSLTKQESICTKIGELLESPDNIKFKDKKIKYTDQDAHPFIYSEKNRLFLGKREAGQSHSILIELILGKELGKYTYTRDEREKVLVSLGLSKKHADHGYLEKTGIHGRYWEKAKIFSFWDYPDKKTFLRIIDELKKQDVPVDDSWQIEVREKEVPTLIPIKDYQGGEVFNSDQLKKDRELHTMSPEQKQKELKKSGATPGYTKLKLPKDMTFAQYYSLVKQEGMEFTNRVPGGRGDKLKPEDVDQKELKMGIAHEMEHTNDRKIAQEIALDHLAEDPKYYSNMKKAGLK